jgi:hypothetical protein
VKPPRAPRLEERRTADFSAELQERARAWLPAWSLADEEHDFGRALLEIAARFSSEVAQRLDIAGEKMRRGFLDWLAERGEAARPARVPVVFKLTDAARAGVLALAPVRMQAAAGETPVVFETEKDVRIVPGQLAVVVGVDADADAFYLPPPGLSDLNPLEPLPAQWQVKSFAAAGAVSFQLDPEAGLLPDSIIEAGDQQYRIVSSDKDLVTIDPPLTAALPKDTFVTKVTTFSPFDQKTRNQQQHALYLGDSDLLNIETAATIAIVGASTLGEGFIWQYWGKLGDKDEVGWQELKPAKKQNQPGALVLEKPKGAVEQREIAGKKGRWIRAFTKTIVPATTPQFTTDEFSIRVNAASCDAKLTCADNAALPSPAAEGMANTTPLVLDNVFFPLGKEPRQFDAFYLGSKEAFSKSDANVQVCFEVADPTFSALATLHDGVFADVVLAGVAKDRALHLLQFESGSAAIKKFREREPLQPPLPGFQGKPAQENVVALDPQPAWRLPLWTEADGFAVAVSAGDAVWVWHEVADRDLSGWMSFGSLPPAQGIGPNPIDGLVFFGGATPKLVALRGGRLFKRDRPDGSDWVPVNTPAAINFKSIVPVLVDNGLHQLIPSEAAGLLGISDANKLFRISTAGVCTQLLAATNFNTAVAPAGFEEAGNLTVAAVENVVPPRLVANHTIAGMKTVPLDNNTMVVGALDLRKVGTTVHVLAAVSDEADGRLLTWAPYATGAASAKLQSSVTPSGGRVGGAVTALARHVVIPGSQADILINDFDPTKRVVASAVVSPGVVLPDSVPPLAVNDLIVKARDAMVPAAPVSSFITDTGVTKTGEVFYPIASAFPATAQEQVFAYPLGATLSGSIAGNQLTLNIGDKETETGMWLRIGGDFFTVGAIDTTVDPWVATISSATGGPLPTTATYIRPIVTGGRTSPFMRLNFVTNGNWDGSVLTRVPIVFPDKTPTEQPAKVFKFALGTFPVIVVLGNDFQEPLGFFDFVIDLAVAEWRRQSGDTATNPELSWEYSDGKAWSKLHVTLDSTLNLKNTGAVEFVVPSDIAASDWAGKTNFWIRARLIGGDYGKEKVIVNTQNVNNGTEQTITRITDGIRAPTVLKLHISYAICKSVQPTFVLAEDSGTVRDQSDANRTPGAIVEAFVPLALTLGRLGKSVDSKKSDQPAERCFPVDDIETKSPEPRAQDDCPECDCQTLHLRKAEAAEIVKKTTDARITGRELYIGLNATLSEAPVNVLLLVNEQPHTKYAPMSIEALTADRFVPIVADDATRALGESGILSMTFAVQPTRSELFGKNDLTWLRLIPKQADENWLPTLRGAYLNAAWASATETLTRELLGSSDGAPNLTVTLARPPVLRNTLELRVREPLGDEERNELLKQDPKSVLSSVKGLPGDWVLWKQVVDPDDEPDTARVYAFDETSGEIRFGDSQHGRIPPVGRNSIVAFTYARTEPDPTGGDRVPGNTIAPRTALNLVSPVETVESVTAADQAAGGAPPESDERVLRYGYARIRHRDRAVTAEDLEDLALESSPDIVQARAFVRRGYIRLVVVMQGKDPVPTAAQVRELRRLLLAAAPVSLSAPGALRIEGPRIRRLRVELELLVDTLDRAGEVSAAVKQKLLDFFDTGTGGIDKDGWQLGDRPSEEDIALAISDSPYLEAIRDVKLHEITADGIELPALEGGSPREIVMLADDPIRIQFETAEVMA